MRRYWYMYSIKEIAEGYSISESKVKSPFEPTSFFRPLGEGGFFDKQIYQLFFAM